LSYQFHLKVDENIVAFPNNLSPFGFLITKNNRLW